MNCHRNHLVVAVTLTSVMFLLGCNKDEPEKAHGSVKSELNIRFFKCANCPVEYISDNIVFQDEIYFTNDNLFLKYTPVSDSWTILNSSPDDDLFVYNNALYCFTGSLLYGEKEFYKYNKATDSWSNASSEIPLPENSDLTDVKSIAGKLYARTRSDYVSLVFNPTSHSWEEISVKNFWNVDVAEIENFGYWLYAGHIYELNTDDNISLTKLDTNNFNEYSMCCRYNSSNDILFIGTDKLWSGIEMSLGIYSPSDNSIKQYSFYNFETASYPEINIPIPFELIANVDGRIFVGPTNAEFYEMIITKN